MLEDLLKLGSPVREATVHENLGCCVFVAILLLALRGQVPTHPDKWQNWRALNNDWWSQANNWHKRGCWATILAALEIIGPAPIQVDWSGRELVLTPGRWHIIQEWDTAYSKGHTYLIYCNFDGTVRKVDSNTRRGYRERTYPHWSRFGSLAALVTLPQGL